jgi:lysophospholipase L1-like esterase
MDLKKNLLLVATFILTTNLLQAQNATKNYERIILQFGNEQQNSLPSMSYDITGQTVTGIPKRYDDSFVYAQVIGWDGKPFEINCLDSANVKSIICLADSSDISFSQNGVSLSVDASMHVTNPVVVFRIEMNRPRRVLFIGDSITDGGWGRSGGSAKSSSERDLTDQNHIYGHSYAMLCAAKIQSIRPNADIQFFNRGISGNTISNLAERWQKDAIDLNPDIVTILIGTNDVDDFLRHKNYETFDTENFEQNYRTLLEQLRHNNPDVKIVLAAPFVAKVGKIGSTDNYEERSELVSQLAEKVKQIADDYGSIYLPFNQMFAQLQQTQPRPDFWIWDGIHPTAAGHQRMADYWINSVSKLLGINL